MKRRQVRFGCAGRGEVFAIDVVVSDEPCGDAPRLDRWQYARYLEQEASHGGAVPLTPEEFDALQSADPGRVAVLASDPGSNLFPLLCWARSEAPPV
jgi:hypothetical protein